VVAYRAVAFRRDFVLLTRVSQWAGVFCSVAFLSSAALGQATNPVPVSFPVKTPAEVKKVAKNNSAQPPVTGGANTTGAPANPATAVVIPALPSSIVVQPPAMPSAPFIPFANLPAPPLDEGNNGIGIAQKWTRERGLQGRVLWIDATANLNKVNTAAKIQALVAKIKATGFNTIVFEVKPIVGYTLYPSRYAPKLTEWVRPWGTQTLPIEFDPLKEFVTQTKLQGIGLLVNMNVFAEGHRDFKLGPGYDNPAWQTILYEPGLRIRRDVSGTGAYPVTDRANLAPRDPDDMSLYTDISKIAKLDAGAYVALIDSTGVVVAQMTAGALTALSPKLPPGGAVLVANTQSSVNFLRLYALPGYKLTLDNTPYFVPISQRPDRQVPLMTNPHSPEVRRRFLNMLTEVAQNYAVDGFIFDDRLRYASLNADFSEAARRDFETFIGKQIKWPDDVFRYDVDFPTLNRAEVPGPYYEAWLTFRALTLRNYLAECVRTIKTIRPAATVSTYVGSWYPDYPDIGANWGADDLTAGFRFLNDSYRKTGWAGLTDFITTGCYFQNSTILEATSKGDNIGETVEAAGQFSNRAINDQSFVYAGLALDKFKGRPDALRRCLQAAAASTQGVMIFDLSHDIDLFWSVFAEAFAKPAIAPHQVPGLITELRAEKERQKAAGVASPPVILYRGVSGTGF
jgi:hypothetical protein